MCSQFTFVYVELGIAVCAVLRRGSQFSSSVHIQGKRVEKFALCELNVFFKIGKVIKLISKRLVYLFWYSGKFLECPICHPHYGAIFFPSIMFMYCLRVCNVKHHVHIHVHINHTHHMYIVGVMNPAKEWSRWTLQFIVQMLLQCKVAFISSY